MTSGVPPNIIAKLFKVDASTPSRWIARGCPAIRRGQRGRGHTALLDPDAVRAWLGQSEHQSGMAPQEILERLADVLHATLLEDRADIRSGAAMADVAKCFVLAFDRACKSFGHQFPFDRLPKEICALMRKL